MKRLFTPSIAVTLSLFTLPIAFAQSQGMGGMEMKGMDMKAEKSDSKETRHKGTGVVTNVDPAHSKVTIKHGPVQSMHWPAMSMTFAVQDKSLFDTLRKDRKVDFEFVQRGKDYVVTSAK
jgi:Cu(I)/Ag(I) efflux system periplasmic protein CusF